MPYQGEEGVYTITSLEMWYHNEWISPLFYGGNYGRPPLFNWLIIPLASFLGFEHVLIASRLIAASASFLTGLVLVWLVGQLFRNRNLAWFAGSIYLSGDLLFRRGWLAYADPLFSLFVFSAISCLWVGLEKKRSSLFALANLALIAAFLSKALTAYSFYFIAFAVLFWRHHNRRFLLSPLSILFHLMGLLFPLFWNAFTGEGAHGQTMMVDVLSRLSESETHFKEHLIKIITYPFSTLLYWMPASGVLVYLFLQNRKNKTHLLADLKLDNHHFAFVSIAFWILCLNYIPYWLAPQNRIRYILPLYPFFALIAAYIISTAKESMVRITCTLLGVLVLIKFCFGFFGYTFIQNKMRGDYLEVAEAVFQKTGQFPVYINDDSATGLSVTAHLNVLRLPMPPLTRCRNRDSIKENGGGFYLVNNPEDYKNTKIFEIYKLGRNTVYLLCEGKACHKQIPTNGDRPDAPA